MDKQQEKKTQGVAGESVAAEPEEKKESVNQKSVISETWAEDTIADLDDFIESQGIYIRQ